MVNVMKEALSSCVSQAENSAKQSSFLGWKKCSNSRVKYTC